MFFFACQSKGNHSYSVIVFFGILTGMMIASLCWKNNEWVGLSMACSISELLNLVKDTVVIDVEPDMSYIVSATYGNKKLIFNIYFNNSP